MVLQVYQSLATLVGKLEAEPSRAEQTSAARDSARPLVARMAETAAEQFPTRGERL